MPPRAARDHRGRKTAYPPVRWGRRLVVRRLLHLGDEVDGMHAARRLSAELSTVVKAEAQVRVRVVGPRAGVLWRGRVA